MSEEGRTKNVISFSIWGNEDKYIKGAIKNFELAKKYYPGWTVRFYYEDGMQGEIFRQLEVSDCEMIPKPYYRDSWFGLYWRFCPMYDDPEISRFIVRDTDARLSEREADAVQEWIESKYGFHIMRDHKAHNINVCGGMWGAKASVVPGFEGMLKKWMVQVKGNPKNPRTTFHGTDQDFLCSQIWPLIKDDHIAHVANIESLRITGKERGFRIENPSGYRVGT